MNEVAISEEDWDFLEKVKAGVYSCSGDLLSPEMKKQVNIEVANGLLVVFQNTVFPSEYKVWAPSIPALIHEEAKKEGLKFRFKRVPTLPA